MRRPALIIPRAADEAHEVAGQRRPHLHRDHPRRDHVQALPNPVGIGVLAGRLIVLRIFVPAHRGLPALGALPVSHSPPRGSYGPGFRPALSKLSTTSRNATSLPAASASSRTT